MAYPKCVGLVACIGLPIVAFGGQLLPDLDLMVRNEFHSAYISGTSGGIGETRPMLSQMIKGTYWLGEWGRVGGYVLTRSALTGQKDEYRRRAFDWFEYGANYTYTWRLSNELGLYTYLNHIWSPMPGWYERGHPLHGVVIEQAFNNPWVAPYYKFLGVYYPNQWETLKVGLRQPFGVFCGRLVVMPYAELICGDRRRYKAKYGDSPFSTYCSMGPFASEFGAVITYKVCEFISARLMLRNWNLINRSARRHEKSLDEPWHVCWLPAVTFAIDVTF